MQKNIILIGMPSVGKTTVGRMLAQSTNKKFVDTDYILKTKTKLTPRDIVKIHGEEFFLECQQNILTKEDFFNSVISTGGSVVYSDFLMLKFKSIGFIVYLKDSLSELKSRIEENRRIIGSHNFSFDELYIQRDELYTKYADIMIDCTNRKPEDILKKIEEEVLQSE
ncbi:MAG: shikimate kinase [Clostridiales bacterium]|nr:shikimate kinase [Clostridiales bacterium]